MKPHVNRIQPRRQVELLPEPVQLTNDDSLPTSPPVQLYQRGLEAARAGKLTLAWEVFSTLIALDPENEEFWVQLAKVAPPQLACRCWRRVLEINPNNLTARDELEKACGPASHTPIWLCGESVLPIPSPRRPQSRRA